MQSKEKQEKRNTGNNVNWTANKKIVTDGAKQTHSHLSIFISKFRTVIDQMVIGWERCVVTGEEGAETYVEGPMGCAHGDSRSPIFCVSLPMFLLHTQE